MSDPELRRLIEEADDDLELALLRSAQHDRPGPNARRRALLALGVGSSIVTATTATAASTTGLAVLKWVGLCAIGTALLAGAAVEVVTPPDLPPPPAARGVERATRASTALAEGLTKPKVESTAAPRAPLAGVRERPLPLAGVREQLPKVDAKRAAAGAKVASKSDDEGSAPSLADEVASLDQAKRALESGNSREALAAIEKHEKSFTGGALGPEAMVIRIEAMAAKGDRAGTTALANEFLAKHPGSPHASRVRSILAAQNAP